MQIFKTKLFDNWAQEVDLNDASLTAAVNEIENRLFDANLGGHIYKKRIAIGGHGKRGGARTILAFKMHQKAIFIYGYAKNKRSNISEKEENALRKLASVYFAYDETQINQAIKLGELIKVKS